ncbi:uncharacterized protein DUF3883 [Halospina denitrificans]|uniref:Uncharacterized protein DUF3883 n=1 Tax=Halospina denitrificans TaxID=332522 RepID=A0A4R7K393_9GAMM|nr:DUF3883 domain-containing protein [Halospina denitrificans]TDT44547.1 uncharacterized protein DUF3883 [Halospina denitrificans]
MSLLDYERRFSQLRANSAGGHKSPHKVAMLTVVIDLIASGDIASNHIPFSEQLKTRFIERLKELGTSNDRPNPHLPFFHLRSEGFWHHQVRPGKSEQYGQLSTVGGPGAIEEHILYAYLDDELFELLQNQYVRELLREALLTNLDDQARAKILRQGNGWDWLECEFTVADYLDMLHKQLAGEQYSKKKHREALKQRLNGRSDSSIEYKHQNISAILVELGLPYIPGYKPASNYQAQLKRAVLAHIAARPGDLTDLSTPAETTPSTPGVINWEKVLDPDLPEQLPQVREPQRQYLARNLNFSEREQRNRKLGERGESFVIDFEQYRLTQAGRQDLAREISWASRDNGDGLGYDILSFDPISEHPLFLEVKTTQSGKYQPFYISENERAFSNDYSDEYRLYRVYQFGDQPKLFVLPGAIEQYAALLPQQYRVSFG